MLHIGRCTLAATMDREIIWETAMVDIPALKQFCDEQLTDK